MDRIGEELLPRPATRHRQVVALIALALLSVPARAQTEGTDKPPAKQDAVAEPEQAQAPQARRSKRPAPGFYAPAATHTWLRILELARVREHLPDHPLELVWKELAKNESRLAGALRTVQTGFDSFAKSYGISPAVMLDVLGADTRIALWTSERGEELAVILRVGDHAPTFQNVLDALPEAGAKKDGDRQGDVRQLDAPFAAKRVLFARLSGKTLFVATDSELVRAGKAAQQLSADPAFGSCGFQTDSNTPWLSTFVRPLDMWKAIGLAEDSPLGARLLASGVANVKAIALRSEIVDDKLREDVSVILPNDTPFPLDFLTAGKPDPKLARLVTRDTTTWFAARVSPRGALAFLERSRVALHGIGRLEILEAELEASEQVKGLDDLASLFGPDVLYLGGGLGAPQGVVLTLQNSFRVKSLLESVATPVEVPGGEDQGVHEFTLERAGNVLHLALCDDFLLASPEAKELGMILEQYLSGEANPTIAKTFELAPDGSWLIGQEDPNVRITALDPAGDAKLQPTALHFDQAYVEAHREGRRVRLQLTGVTGGAHLSMIALNRLLPDLLDRRDRRAEASVVTLLDALHAAQEAFVASAAKDRDEDGAGEAGSISELAGKKLFTPPADVAGSPGGEILESAGYRFTVLKPEDIETGERHFAILAWPARPGVSGRLSYLLREDGSLWAHRWVSDLDATAGPTLRQVFEGEPWASGLEPAWSARRAAPTTIAPAAEPEPTAPVHELDKLELARAQMEMDKARRRMDGAALLEYLGHPDETIQARAVHYLGDIKDVPSLPLLARKLKESENPVVRRRAARALALIRDPKSAATLIPALGDEDPKIRLFAATGLLGVKAPGAQRALFKLIDRFPEDTAGDRSQAVLALADMKDPSVLDHLVVVTAGGPKFMSAIVYTFQSLSPQLPPEKEVEVLTKALASPMRPLRAYAIQRLGASGRMDALPALIARVKDEEPGLQEALRVSIDALTPKEEPGVQDVLSNVGKSAREMARKLGKQPPMIKYALGLTPVVLLLLLVGYWWSRRRGRARREQMEVEELVQPSEHAEADAMQHDSGVYDAGDVGYLDDYENEAETADTSEELRV